jgi:hypothetical protein
MPIDPEIRSVMVKVSSNLTGRPVTVEERIFLLYSVA